MKRFVGVAVTVFSMCFQPNTFAQCSDAGVCTIGKGHKSLHHSLGLTYSYGRSTKSDDLNFHSLHLNISLSVFESSGLMVSIPWSRQSGPLGSTSGLGDLTLVWDQELAGDNDSRVSLQFGGKLAIAAVNDGNLPQRYQSGLGTNDVLLGLRYGTSHWTGSLGYQIAGGRSENAADQLKRGDDLLIRAGYTTEWNDYSFSGELLAIKRLKESSVRNPLIPGNAFYDIPKSDQFQVNILGTALIPLQGSSMVQLATAVPLLKREVNVDGLTRSISLSAGLVFSF
jgi:hypothetical protein